jgi:hypothetical protein
MRILGIETSCDETGVAIYDSAAGLLGHALHSQIDLHACYGGVVPELASRDHVRRLLPMIRQLLTTTGTKAEQIDGSEGREVVLTIAGTPLKLNGEQYLLHFSLPNFYFHCTTAYAILRQSGVEIGKRDFLGAA